MFSASESNKRELTTDEPASELPNSSATVTADVKRVRIGLADTKLLANEPSVPDRICLIEKGIVLLKHYLDETQQRALAQAALGFGILSDRASCNNEKAKNMHMLCIGRQWDQETKGYKISTPIPPLLIDLVNNACKEAMKLTNVGANFMPDQCVVNYYKPHAHLSLHDEQNARGAVISISLGDSAQFVFKKTWSKKIPLQPLLLESGDILVFGGKARSIVHGVSHILPNTRPSLFNELGIDGRINYNVREE